MSAIKLRRHSVVKAEFEFDARELAETFTDEQLREAGLYRDLRDADLARERQLRAAEQLRHHACEDDDCDCPCHGPGQVPPYATGHLPESAFWPMVRALLLRGDRETLARELEQRAWLVGNTSTDFQRVLVKE